MLFDRNFFDGLDKRIQEYKKVFGWQKSISVIIRSYGTDYYLLSPRIDKTADGEHDNQTITFIYHDEKKAVPIPDSIKKKQEIEWNHVWPAVTLAYKDIEAVVFDASMEGKPGFQQQK